MRMIEIYAMDFSTEVAWYRTQNIGLNQYDLNKVT